jgi:hypothetical protein
MNTISAAVKTKSFMFAAHLLQDFTSWLLGFVRVPGIRRQSPRGFCRAVPFHQLIGEALPVPSAEWAFLGENQLVL